MIQFHKLAGIDVELIVPSNSLCIGFVRRGSNAASSRLFYAHSPHRETVNRYERAGTIIVSQLPVAKWHEYLAEPTIADAILDRLVPKAHRVKLTGASLRRRNEIVPS